MEKNFELKLYEKLGVLHFRKIPRGIAKSISKGETLAFSGTNYFLSGSSIDDIKAFQKQLIVNGSVHVFCLTAGAISIFSAINTGSNIFLSMGVLATVINTYCAMLQRYNWVRIKQVLKKYEKTHKKNEKIETHSEILNDGFIEVDKSSDNIPNKVLYDWDGRLPYILNEFNVDINNNKEQVINCVSNYMNTIDEISSKTIKK